MFWEKTMSTNEVVCPDWTGQAEPIPSADLERYRDAEWALHAADVQQQYHGQWVVAYERRIIAHGMDAQAVAEEAGRLVKGQAHRLVLCLREDTDVWLEHTSDTTADFPDA